MGTGEWTDRQILSIITSRGKETLHTSYPLHDAKPILPAWNIPNQKKRSSSVSKILTKYVKMSTSRKKNKSLGRNSQSASQAATVP